MGTKGLQRFMAPIPEAIFFDILAICASQDSADFRSDIAQHDWGSIDQLNNPNDVWAKWKEMFLECIDRYAPLKSKRVRLSKSPWINSN